MHTAISRGQWQPQTAVSPSLKPTSVAPPLGKPASQKPHTAEVSAKQSIKRQLHTTHVGAVGWEPHSSSTTTCAGKVDQALPSKLKQGAHIHQPTKTTAWPLPHACAQPYQAGSGSHGQLFRPSWSSSSWHSRNRKEHDAR